MRLFPQHQQRLRESGIDVEVAGERDYRTADSRAALTSLGLQDYQARPAALVIPYGTMSAVELSITSIMDKVFVDDWGQCRGGRFGALRAHVDQGLVTESTIAGELADVVAGTRPGRERGDERILFWHRGLATTDIALGQAILDRAVEQGVGTLLPYR